MTKLRVGLALTGSFCTFDKALTAAEQLRDEFDFLPIMSETAASTDTRFGRAEDFQKRLEEFSGKKVIKTITEAEPIGPGKMIDVLLIAPCTGNTLAKLAGGINDSSVTMAAKSHIRNGGAVVLAISTNDGLSASAKNIGALLVRKNVFFVPFYQDAPEAKPRSLAADYSQLKEAVLAAYEGKQLQPILKYADIG